MKKKILSVVALSALFMGTVSASSINGEFRGNPIVKVKSNGQVLAVEDTPAVIYEDRTMVPIYMLRKLGADVTWSDSDFSVDVKLPSAKTTETLKEVSARLKKYGVTYIMQYSDGSGLDAISYSVAGTLDDLYKNDEAYNAIMYSSLNFIADNIEIIDKSDNSVSIAMKAFKDYNSGKITAQEFMNQYKMSGPTQSTSSTPSGSIQPSSSGTTTQTPSQSVPPSTTPTDAEIDKQVQEAHAAVCKNIEDKYVLLFADAERNNNPFSGKSDYLMTQLQAQYQQEKTQAGCN